MSNPKPNPKPIDPKRLELARTLDIGNLSIIGELVSDRDYLYCELGIEHELRLKAYDERDALRMKLAEHGISSDVDIDVRRYQDQLQSVEDRVSELVLRKCENDLMKALGFSEHNGWDSLLEYVPNINRK